MEWVIKKMSRRSTRTFKHSANLAHIERTLKFCPTCKMVWSISLSGSAIRYTDMPTYGLNRIICKICEK